MISQVVQAFRPARHGGPEGPHYSFVLSALLVLAFAASASAQTPTQAPDGNALFQRTCAQCHMGGVNRAPDLDVLRAMSADRVLAAMETGPMISMATGRSAAERRAIAEAATGKKLRNSLDVTPLPKAMCAEAAASAAFNPASGPSWGGWGGASTSNARFQTASAAGLTTEDIPKLKLKWAFGFPGDLQSNAQATIYGGRVFVGSPGGGVYSISASTGCVHWFYQATAGVRSAMTVTRVGTRDLAFFGDQNGNAYAVDAATGKLAWKNRIEDFPVARISGSPTFYNGRVYFPVASGEEASGSVPTYECCKFRGSVVALNAADGKLIWKSYMIPEAAKPTTKNKIGTQLWGPSGSPVWASPAIDPRRNALYVNTGNSYSDPATDTSDAFVALDLDTGKMLWHRQMTKEDAYISACRLPDKTNCPSVNGPDFDFSASPILVTLANGRRLLVAGQKSGIVHALDPDKNGEIVWQTRVGLGGTMGGVQWGSATDGQNVYVANSDIGRIMLTYSNFTDADSKRGGGMYALKLETGEKVWFAPPSDCGTRPRCSPAQSAAVSAFPGIALSGSVDGHMRAYSTTDGKVLWDYDTERPYETVNGVEARGGSLDGPGPAIGGGMIFLNSGYPTAGGQPGNVLLAFSVDGK
jgi:polyvinyl alcohol dehydrogenase (cytochrome)